MEHPESSTSEPTKAKHKKYDKKHHGGVKHRHKKKPHPSQGISGEVIEDISGEFIEDISGEFIEDISGEVIEDISGEVIEDISGGEQTTENIYIVCEDVSQNLPIHEIYSDKESSDEEDIIKPMENEFAREEIKKLPTPKLVFIVPYRDREQQLKFFVDHMKKIMEDYSEYSYRIIYVHQNDTRSFNRGAMKNIGFLYVKQQYPESYKNITLVFNDVDTMPMTKNFLNYETNEGIVKHFYGYTFTLGGIVSIRCSDFEKVNGYANYWAWGYEDNVLQDRVLKAKLHIDRSQYYPIMDKNILQMKDGLTRLVNRGEFDKYEQENKTKKSVDGINTIKNLKYVYDESTNFLNVNSFVTKTEENKAQTQTHDMRRGAIPFKRTRPRARMGMFIR